MTVSKKCSRCFYCKIKLPLLYKKGQDSILQGRIGYNTKTEIRCDMNMWERDDGEDKIYERSFNSFIKLCEASCNVVCNGFNLGIDEGRIDEYSTWDSQK